MIKRLIAMLLVLATMLSLMGSAAPAVIGEGAVSDAAVEEVIAAAVADEAASDYTADIGKHAEFSADLVATDWIEVLDTEPAEAWSSMLYNRYEFSDDIRFEIIDRKVVAEYYDVTDEETGEVTGQSAMYSLWYCVNVVAGTAVPEGFFDGYWILQNYLDEDAYEVDTLRLFAVCPVCKEEDCTDEHSDLQEATEQLVGAGCLEEYEELLASLDAELLAELQVSAYWTEIVEAGYHFVYSHFYSLGTEEEYNAHAEQYPDAWEYIQSDEELKYYMDLHLERIRYVAENPLPSDESSVVLGEIVYVTLPGYTHAAGLYRGGSSASSSGQPYSAEYLSRRGSSGSGSGANEDDNVTTPEDAPSDNSTAGNGVYLGKSLKYDETTGEYTIRLESYATGSSVTVVTQTELPADIILVLDLSNSMTMNSMDNVGYQAVTEGTAQDIYEDYDGNLYVEIDGSYKEVTITGNNGSTTTAEEAYTGSYDASDLYEYLGSNKLYYYVDGEYKEVTGYRTGNGKNTKYYFYYDGDQTTGTLLAGSLGRNDYLSETVYPLYTITTETTYDSYTYSYVDTNGTTVVIDDYAPTDSIVGGTNPTYYVPYANGTITRAEALKNAVTNFANQVATKAKGADGTAGTTDDVAHNIAIVGFNNSTNDSTGIYIGDEIYNYGTEAQGVYGTALQDMSTEQGANNITASIDALINERGTYTYYGTEMANGILAAYAYDPNRYVDENGNTIRSKVVVIFTDGEPNAGNGYDKYDDPILDAYDMKNTYGATVYTVGILDGGDVTIPPTTDLNKYMHYMSSNYKNAQSMDNPGELTNTNYATNGGYYLLASNAQDLNNIFSSISSSATSGGATIELSETTEVRDVISPYFRLPEGTTTSDIKLYTSDYNPENSAYTNGWGPDVAYTPVGETPIVIETVDYTDEDGNYVYDENGNRVTIDVVKVTGFDFADNWVGEIKENGVVTEYHGQKLVIEFPVEVNPDFLGGSGVISNGADSGIYGDDGNNESGVDKEEIDIYNQPSAEEELKLIETVAQDRNIYYGNTIDLADILALYVKESESSQALQIIADGVNNAYVDLVYTVTLADSTVVIYTVPAGADWEAGTWTNVAGDTIDMSAVYVTEDTNYSITCKMTNKDDSTQYREASGSATIYVYKPTITFKDSLKVPNVDSVDYAAENLVSITWSGNNPNSSVVEGNDNLVLTYTPDANCVDANGLVISGHDFHVNVGVVNNRGTEAASDDVDLLEAGVVTFEHGICDLVSPCGFDSAKGEFMIHVSTGNLEITKDITVLDGNNPPNPADFTFTVVPADDATAIAFAATGKYTYYIDDALKGELTVTDGKLTVTLDDMEYEEVRTIRIVGLPVGDYTVEEADVTGFATNFAGDETYEYTASATITRNTTVKLDCENVFPVYVGNLTLTKNVEKEYGGDTVDSEQEFTFTVTLTPENGVLDVLRKFACTKQVGDGAVEAFDLEFADSSTSATINVTLKAGETVSFTGLPVGKYDIAETEVTGFTTTSTGASGEIETSETASAVFTNTLERSTGNLKFTKIVDNKTDEALGAYDFTFIVTMPTGTTYEEYASSFTTIPEGVTIEAFSDTENQFKITVHFDSIASGKGNNAEVTLVGVPSGEYFIDETPVVGFGATWSEADQKVTVTKDETAEITCTNTYPINNGELTIVKKLTEASDEDQTFVFDVAKADATVMRVTVTVPAGDTEKSVTIEGLELGTYTVTEDENWNWRYSLQSASPNGDVTLSATTPTATKTFTNKYSKNKWLSDEVSVKNIFTASGELKSTKIN